MPSPSTAWRIDLARQVIAHYVPTGLVPMAGIGGSVARGEDDPYSDLDIILYWTAVDGDWIEATPMLGDGVNRFTFVRYPAPLEGIVLEQYFLGEQKIDVAHLPVAWLEERLRAVLEEGEVSAENLELMGGLLEAVALHGQEQYEQYRARVKAYPKSLREHLVKEHLKFYPAWVWSIHGLERGDLLGFYSYVVEMLKNLVAILAALNGVYQVSEKPKHTDRLLRSIAIAPRDVADRVQAILTGPREEAPAIYAALVAETLDHIDTHLPAVSTERARLIQQIPMSPCTERPTVLDR